MRSYLRHDSNFAFIVIQGLNNSFALLPEKLSLLEKESCDKETDIFDINNLEPDYKNCINL